MRILLTGATGFLGKHVLARLIADERVDEILVVSRRKRHHESPKVRIAVMDLISATRFPDESPVERIDCVIHLAGLYDFHAGYRECYEHNVIATTKLLWLLKDKQLQLPIHFASTYAVGCPNSALLTETALEDLPPKELPYAHSKAIAEKVLAESGSPVRIFRLGILMGDSRSGEIEKIDGVYTVMDKLYKLARKLKTVRGIKIPILPVSADPETLLPLTPVDLAAAVLAESPFEGKLEPGETEYFGVFNPESATVGRVLSAIRDRVLPGARVVYIPSRVPSPVARLIGRLPGVPEATYRYANHSTKLDSTRFSQRFPKHRVPDLSELEQTWFEGFKKYSEYGND